MPDAMPTPLSTCDPMRVRTTLRCKVARSREAGARTTPTSDVRTRGDDPEPVGDERRVGVGRVCGRGGARAVEVGEGRGLVAEDLTREVLGHRDATLGGRVPRRREHRVAG